MVISKNKAVLADPHLCQCIVDIFVCTKSSNYSSKNYQIMLSFASLKLPYKEGFENFANNLWSHYA